MALAAFDPFVREIRHGYDQTPRRFSHGWRIHDRRTWMGIPADPSTLSLMQRPVKERPEAGAAKLTPMILHRLPWREIAGQIAPGTTGTKQIKKSVEDGPEAVAAESPARRSARQKLLEALPLGIRKIARIGTVHTSECNSCCRSSVLQNTFLAHTPQPGSIV
jgi:hypothetical protein